MYKYVTHGFGCLANASFAFTKKRERMSCAAYSLTYFITPPRIFNIFYWRHMRGDSPATPHCKAGDGRAIAISVSVARAAAHACLDASRSGLTTARPITQMNNQGKK